MDSLPSHNPHEKIQELIEKIRTGEIYGEIQAQLEENLKKRKKKKGPLSSRSEDYIEELQNRIRKKEDEVAKILGEIIRLKNELSEVLQKELGQE